MKLYNVYRVSTWEDSNLGRNNLTDEVVVVAMGLSDEWLESIDHETEEVKTLEVGVPRPRIIG